MQHFLVTGSRDWDDIETITNALAQVYRSHGPITLMHGDCRGADTIASNIWKSWGFLVEACPADWEKYGKRAGFIRNSSMVDTNPIGVLAFMRDKSKGTQMTIDLCIARSIPVRVYSP